MATSVSRSFRSDLINFCLHSFTCMWLCGRRVGSTAVRNLVIILKLFVKNKNKNTRNFCPFVSEKSCFVILVDGSKYYNTHNPRLLLLWRSSQLVTFDFFVKEADIFQRSLLKLYTDDSNRMSVQTAEERKVSHVTSMRKWMWLFFCCQNATFCISIQIHINSDQVWKHEIILINGSMKIHFHVNDFTMMSLHCVNRLH